MDEKQIIKWGLIALGVYLVYEYIQTNGGFAAVLGTGTNTTTCGTGLVLNAAGQCIAASTANTGSTTSTNTNTATPPVLDMTGLSVVPDVNSSLTGTVKINGVPTRLSIITATGEIFNSSGQDITASLQGEGVDVVSLRTAFQAAAPAANLSPCVQPNFFNSAGICVDAFTQQPIPNTVTQMQQNAGMSGLGAFSKPNPRWRPEWLN